ncbi:MAG: PAS domain-containing protein, partial [Chlorobiales bacterium]|nr:PAS domain-containing protein [Chlorobiales bacterium]
GFRISREIRETIVFAPHNVIMDPPFTKLDILVCRNLLIYMEQELQKKLLPLFHYSLNPGGILFLGSAETIGSSNHLFESLDNKTRLFRQSPQAGRSKPLDFPAAYSQATRVFSDIKHTPNPSELNLQEMTDQILLHHYAPAAVLTNANGDIIYINGRTGKYLEPAAGKANWNIFAMAREGLRFELNTLFGNTVLQKTPLFKKGVIIGSEGEKEVVDLRVEQLEKPDSLRGLVLIVFEEVKKNPLVELTENDLAVDTSQTNLLSLKQDLKVAKDEILTVREEMQTSQEELKSTNEEMQSANEELQSTNEELTTSKEEMQSLNEELQTVNQELQSKVSDLSQANNDMKNLLNSTDIATLFLDDSLNIRRFTTRTSTIIKLITNDIGRPITDIVTDLHYPTLADDAREVLHSLVYSEKQVSASDGRWFTVRIMPYRTQENRIDGLVLTFTDITGSKKFEQSLKESDESFRFLFDAIPGGAMLQNAEGKIKIANSEAQRILGFSIEEMLDKTTSELRWKILREDGSVLPFEEYPALVALRTGQPSSNTILGIDPATPHQSCRWIKAHTLLRLHPEKQIPVQVYTFFVEIPAPVPEKQKV